MLTGLNRIYKQNIKLIYKYYYNYVCFHADAYQVSFDYSISAVVFAAFVLFIITYTPTVTWYTRRKYSKNINVQANSSIKSELLSSEAEHDIHKQNSYKL